MYFTNACSRTSLLMALIAKTEVNLFLISSSAATLEPKKSAELLKAVSRHSRYKLGPPVPQIRCPFALLISSSGKNSLHTEILKVSKWGRVAHTSGLSICATTEKFIQFDNTVQKIQPFKPAKESLGGEAQKRLPSVIISLKMSSTQVAIFPISTCWNVIAPHCIVSSCELEILTWARDILKLTIKSHSLEKQSKRTPVTASLSSPSLISSRKSCLTDFLV
ncbi:unnamed protein product [Allacma fusca]|uniref:Uncharacterized protein n=1 Tax=Allacma fusca TaxID=39272 RepID=A0A8J2NSU7_9HEXA|nr:unnamed protein product [Allacma fusca]